MTVISVSDSPTLVILEGLSSCLRNISEAMLEWCLQVALGQVLHQLDELLPANSLPLDDIFAAALLVFFGVKTLLVSTLLYFILAFALRHHTKWVHQSAIMSNSFSCRMPRMPMKVQPAREMKLKRKLAALETVCVLLLAWMGHTFKVIMMLLCSRKMIMDAYHACL